MAQTAFFKAMRVFFTNVEKLFQNLANKVLPGPFPPQYLNHSKLETE